MKREIIKTADGSSTIYLPEWNEHYHSKHGAIQEAQHVFMSSGLEYFVKEHGSQKISILEIGFGTGLNALVTFLVAQKTGISVRYTGVEAFPVTSEEWKSLDYASLFKDTDASEVYEKLHDVKWEKFYSISPFFELQKQEKRFHEIGDEDEYDLVFFDAFGPRVQPELWTEEIFKKMHRSLHSGGILVTYSAKGSVRRALQSVGFEVERLPGPPGKREMLRASRRQ